MNKLSMMPIALVLSSVLTAPASFAQPITPAADGTNTQVNPEGNQFNITGGSLSGDRTNLFHSFEQFGLDAGQVANFLSSPEIQNILGRVTGGDASIINGLIQITGGNSNLFLMNPAGILFGPNASLNVPASFTATTATGIGFGTDWFQAVGDNNWGNLVGMPSQFAFEISQPGGIANLGNLTLLPGQNLTLLGGVVLNAGTLSSPGGNITVAAIPGESRVRISQQNHLLSLEVTPSPTHPLTSQLTPLSLPELLTGSGVSHANQVQVNPDGTVALTGSHSQVPVESGDVVASGNIQVTGESGGTVQVLGDRVAVVGANIDASGMDGGGTVLVGGEYQGEGPVPNASDTFVSRDSIISADALSQGDGGRVIIWADDTTTFRGTINARGGVEPGVEPHNGGFVEVSGKKNLIFRGAVDLSAPNGSLGTLLLDPENIIIVSATGAEDDPQLIEDIPNDGDAEGAIFAEDGDAETYTISEFFLETLPGDGNIILEATNDIIIEDLDLEQDGALGFEPGTGSITFRADADGSGIGSFVMQNTENTISAEGRSVSISGANITVGDINTGVGFGPNDGGAITLNATNGTIEAETLNSSTNLVDGGVPGNGGAVTVTATGDITVNTIDTRSFSIDSGTGNGGPITVISDTGNILVQTLDSSTIVPAGVPGNNAGNGGDILVEALNGSVDTSTIVSNAQSLDGTAGTGGNVVVNAGTSLSISNLLNSRSSALNNGGNVELTGNQIVLPPEGLDESNNGGILLLQPSTPDTNIVINPEGDVPGSLTLVQSQLGNLNLGFDSITIGRADGSGTVTLDSFENFIDAPLTVRSPNGAITVNTPLEAIDTASITLQGATTLNSDITTVNQPIAIQGDVTLGLNPIILTSGNGPINLTGQVNGNQSLTLDAGVGEISITGAIGGVNPVGDLTANSTGITQFGGPINAASLTTNAGGTTQLNGDVTTTGATGQVYGNNVTTPGNLTLTGDELSFGGTVTGSGLLTLQPANLNTPIALGNATEIGVGTLDITAADLGTFQGFTALSIGRVDGNGAISSANLSLTVPTTIQSGNGGITLAGANGAQPLTVSSTTGTVALSGALGNVTPLSSLSVNTGGIATLGNAITTNGPDGVTIAGTGGINLTGPVTLNSSTGNGAVALTGAVNGNFPLTLTSGNGTVILPAIGTITPAASLTVNSTNTAQLTGNITTQGVNGVTVNAPTTLASPVTIDTRTGNGPINVTGTVDGNFPLTLTAGTANVQLTETVGGIFPLTQLTIAGGILDSANLNVGSGGINLTGSNITLNTINTTAGGTLGINNSGTLNLTGLLNLAGFFSQTGTGPVILGNNLTTANQNISFNSPVTLTGTPTISAGTGSLSFNNTLNAGTGNLSLTANEMQFGGAISGTGLVFLSPGSIDRNIQIGGTLSNNALNLSLAELNLFQPGFTQITIGRIDSTGLIAIAPLTLSNQSFFFQGGNGIISLLGLLRGSLGTDFTFFANEIELTDGIETDGTDIVLDGNVTLAADVTLNTGPGDGTITFERRVNGPHQLTLQAGTGDVEWLGAVGGTEPLAGTTASGNTILLSSELRTLGDIILNSDLRLIDNTAIASETGDIQFNGLVDSLNTPINLTLSAGGGITLNQAVGSQIPLAQFEISDATSVTATDPINANTVAISADQIQLEGDITTTGGSVNITANNQLTVGNITTSGGAIAVINNTGDTNAGNLNSSNPTGTGGAVSIEAPNAATLGGDLISTGETGGNIRVIARDRIQVGNIDSSGTIGSGGNVFIDPENDTEVGYINAQGGNSGSGGDIFIQTGQFFRATNTFSDRNGQTASISSAGGQGGGSISLTHGGGDLEIPLVIGDNSTNGTAGVITTGSETLTLGESFLGPVTRGNIGVITGEVIPPEEPEEPIGEPIEEPISTPRITPGPTDIQPLPSPTPATGEIASETPAVAEPTAEASPAEEVSPEETSPPVAVESPVVEETNPVIAPTIEPPAIAPATIDTPAIAPDEIVPPAQDLEPTLTTPEPVPSLLAESPRQPTAEPPVLLIRQGIVETVRSAIERNFIDGNQGPARGILQESIAQNIDTGMGAIEQVFTDSFSQHSGIPPGQIASLTQAQTLMGNIEAETGVKPALIYVRFAPISLESDRDEDQLEILIVTAEGQPIPKRIPNTSRAEIQKVANAFRGEITATGIRRNRYLQSAQQLYNWIIAPIETELKAQNIQNLAFIMDSGLRSLPLAALHDGNQFLVEKYSVGLMPSLSLTDTRYADIKTREVLAMGASEFTELDPLPAVPLEMETITTKVRKGQAFLNELFTLETLKRERNTHQYSIVHLATHGEFQSGKLSNSYIQLWDRKLKMDEIRELGFNDPPLELLVLSACRTAVGDEQAELGFAGLAVQAGAKTALASLWYVSDEGTFGFMSEFYHHLSQAPIKAEALRQTQIAMIQGQVRVEDGILYTADQEIPLPEAIAHLSESDLTHPYYWSAFTLIGSPW
ncbi:CHAT domain-containing protein [Oscillatoria acuminata]|uniref:Filamentous hemagglutinin family N-terminal domain protein n=1 Tax=Oscillatoria acuminata PCC 6304 TaxID=56110 RepID=K9TJY1_9CYAN|nr:CHAT domain-containing protein [Oscillatoria acuminata]AFY82461.1 filamentous hemagglutinin family N-terminal domain protein [Oscillatoria acuminata PCC 6304]